MNPRRFLLFAGPVLIVVGILGITGLFGRISSASFFHPPYWINWFHLCLGLVVWIVAFVGRPWMQTALAGAAMILGLTLGILGLSFGSLTSMQFNIPELADPSDHIVHLIVGLFGTWGWMSRKQR